ncbi:putative RDD family membrane protein YckC [Kibdelosporangium banguiense]|uniref:RDD family membrane protein YckC n=1 Tax=Kibdelosporangium banguiense TaxID=1365924 RepID=A0ABS4T5D6_9PSEU|nr:RDD family protein [Kibdelosporangium banguiense]MBP2319683.1 putative RDD family membrane protein YckC [Kibdelosporangium banguiense]
MPLATLGSRLAARLIDLLILFIPTYVAVAVAVEGGLWGTLLLSLLEMVVYDALLTANTGATPGKRMLRIKVVRVGTGAPAGWTASFLRALAIGVPSWLVTAVVVLLDERTHRGQHDLLAGTVVIAV